jgi:hypothetical protein
MRQDPHIRKASCITRGTKRGLWHYTTSKQGSGGAYAWVWVLSEDGPCHASAIEWQKIKVLTGK